MISPARNLHLEDNFQPATFEYPRRVHALVITKRVIKTTTGWDFLEGLLTILNIHECGIAMNCRIDNLHNHQVVTTPSSPAAGLARACAQCGPTLPGVACTGPSSGSGVAQRGARMMGVYGIGMYYIQL